MQKITDLSLKNSLDKDINPGYNIKNDVIWKSIIDQMKEMCPCLEK
jgi:hypothetical protein